MITHSKRMTDLDTIHMSLGEMNTDMAAEASNEKSLRTLTEQMMGRKNWKR